MFKVMLNERYRFHAVDGLIITIIIASIAITIVGLLGRGIPEFKIIGGISMIVIGIPLSIISIIYALKLLKLNGTLNGLLKPIVYTQLATSICFLTFVLIPVGFLIMIANTVLIGLSMMRGQEETEELEFI